MASEADAHTHLLTVSEQECSVVCPLRLKGNHIEQASQHVHQYALFPESQGV